MSIDNRNIKEGIQRLAGVWGKDYTGVFDCEIISVDEQARTCIGKPLTGNLSGNITINLLAQPNDGFLLIPSVESTVVVFSSNKHDYFIGQYSDIEKVKITIGQLEILMTENEILLGDGSFDGLVKVGDLVTKLNNLENKVNSIIATYNAHTHLVASFGTPSAPPVAVITGTLTPTIQSEIENTIIKQGI